MDIDYLLGKSESELQEVLFSDDPFDEMARKVALNGNPEKRPETGGVQHLVTNDGSSEHNRNESPVADRKRPPETVSVTSSCQQPPPKVQKHEIVQLPSKKYYLIIGDKDNSPKRIANQEWRNVRGEQRDITKGKTDEQIAADIELLRSDLFDRVKARAAEGESLPSKDEIALIARSPENDRKGYIKAHSKFYKFNNDEKFYGIASDKKIIDHIKTLKPAGKNSGYQMFKGPLPEVLEKARKNLCNWIGSDPLKRQVSKPFEELLREYEKSVSEDGTCKLCEENQELHVKNLNESWRTMKKRYKSMQGPPQSPQPPPPQPPQPPPPQSQQPPPPQSQQGGGGAQGFCGGNGQQGGGGGVQDSFGGQHGGGVAGGTQHASLESWSSEESYDYSDEESYDSSEDEGDNKSIDESDDSDDGVASGAKIIDHTSNLQRAGESSGCQMFRGPLPIALIKAKNNDGSSKLNEKYEEAQYDDMLRSPQGGNLVNREERDVNDDEGQQGGGGAKDSEIGYITEKQCTSLELWSSEDGSFADIKVIHECGQPKVHSGTIKSLEKEHRIEREKRARDGVEKSEMKRLRLEAHPDLPEGIDNPRKHQYGGQAIVYRGTMAGKDVAVKVFREKSRETCKKEVQLLMRLPRHPNVIEVLAFYKEPTPSFVMRFISGDDLFDRLKQHGRFVGDEAVRLLKGIGEGLRHLHAHGIVHRDVKSTNIMLEVSGGCLQPVLIDLGVSKVMESSGPLFRYSGLSESMVNKEITSSRFQTSSPKGTTLWMAPEMFMRREWSTATDMYALGIVMWEILTGRVPYAEFTFTFMCFVKHVTSGVRPDVSGMTHVPPAQVDLMKELWHQDPSKRPSVEEFLGCL